MSKDAVTVVLYSADADRRKHVIEGIGRLASKDSPPITWVETATSPGALGAVEEHMPPVVVLDADTPKVGGMAVAQDIINELEQNPVIILLTARPMDNWLAQWAGASYTVMAPYNPLELQETMAAALSRI